MSLINYELEILNVHKEDDKKRSIKAHGFEHTEYGRLNFFKYEDSDLKREKNIIASYPADSINVISGTITDEVEK